MSNGAGRLEGYFQRAASDYKCVICGETVKNGLRRTHEQVCKISVTDDDIVCVGEFPSPANTSVKTMRQKLRPNDSAGNSPEWKRKRSYVPATEAVQGKRNPNVATSSESIKEAATIISSPKSELSMELRVCELFSDAARCSSPLDVASPKASDGLSEDINPVDAPYIVKCLLKITQRVTSDVYHQHLFDEDSQRLITTVFHLTEDAQYLLARFLVRKRSWIPVEDLRRRYGGTCGVDHALQSLSDAKFVDSAENLVTALEEALDLLRPQTVQDLAKMCRIKNSNGPKGTIIADLISHCNRQRSLHGSIKDVLMQRAKDELRMFFRLSEEIRHTFLRIFNLFSLQHMSSANFASSKLTSLEQLMSSLLYTLHQKERNELCYPAKAGLRRIHPFSSILELNDYIDANGMEIAMLTAMDAKRYTECVNINTQALSKLLLLTLCNFRHDHLPSHLRRFTAMWVQLRVATIGAAAMEKLKDFASAVAQYEDLVRMVPADWCRTLRGKWYERWSLNLTTHLKQPEKALEVIEKAKLDEITDDIRWSLYERANDIIESRLRSIKGRTAKTQLRKRLESLKPSTVMLRICKRTISGQLLSKALGGRRKTIFATKDNRDGSVTTRNVEEVAKHYYMENEGFAEGMHCEGGAWLTLYGLFFWEIIHDVNVPDVVWCSQQAEPLDFNDSNFYAKRLPVIEQRLSNIRESTTEQLCNDLVRRWDDNYGKMSASVSWDTFTDKEQAQRFLKCISSVALATLFERLASDFRNTRSGFPDLVLWNEETNKLMVVEVKGPGDRLSIKQRLWLNAFTKAGIAAEVCHVQGVSSKSVEDQFGCKNN